MKLWLISIWFGFLPIAAAGQTAPHENGTVNGTGSVVLKRQPDIMRVRIELTAKGKDFKEALSKLRERREAARSRLIALGAPKDSLEFGETTLTTDKNPQMEAMIRARMGTAGRKPTKTEAEPVVLVVNLKADLPLKPGDIDELMLVAHTLQQKIKNADLAGLKEIKAASPQEEEAAEENEMMNSYDPSSGPPRGEPVFQYVSKVPEAERTKAIADAFQKAKAEASKLAQAAGMNLGRLQQLNSQSTSSPGSGSRSPYEEYYMYRAMHMASGAADADNEASAGEAVGMQPGIVTLRLVVNASFYLNEAKK